MIRRFVIPLALLCAAAGAGWLFHSTGREPATEAHAASARQGRAAVVVEAAEVTISDVSTVVTAVGNLQANESVVVAPKIAGRIAEILFEDGQRVGKGAVLVRLEEGVLTAAQGQAGAAHALDQGK